MAKYTPSNNTSASNNHFQKKSSLSFTESSDDIKSLIMANAIYDKFDMDWTNKFARFNVLDPYNALTTTREFVFITKPDLCLFDTATHNISGALASNPFFVDALNRYRNVAMQLQSSMDPNGNPFMTVLSNSLTSSLDLPGISAETVETASNVMGTKITYRGTSLRSDEEFDFNLEFEDTKFLDVYMLFKMYDEYEKLKWAGAIDFSPDVCGSNRWENYIINKVLHDQVSMYKFVVAEDGYRIIYWARLTGCFPTSIPRDAFSDMNNSDTQKITVGWRSHFVRDMDPIIIQQFNGLVGSMARYSWYNDLPLYNKDIHAMEGRWAYAPYISIQTVNDNRHGQHREYYLRWRG